jgi:hypothetical protein
MSEKITVEQIIWHRVEDRLPDDDMVVLISLLDDGEPVWMGWRDQGVWRQIDGSTVDRVIAWSVLPKGIAS